MRSDFFVDSHFFFDDFYLLFFCKDSILLIKCPAIVTVEDNIAPEILCPTNEREVVRNTECNYEIKDYTGVKPAWDNCDLDDVVITQSPLPGTIVQLENASQTITITATDKSGNSTSCSFEVYVRCVKELDIPQFFSPNGDGNNDSWEIPELANYPNNTLKVFNRWGNLVFEEKGYTGGWEGIANADRSINKVLGNKMLPEGTYYYIIDLGDENFEPYTGYLFLKR